MRIPTKPAGDSDLKPAVIPRRSRPPVRSEAGQGEASRGSWLKITIRSGQVKRRSGSAALRLRRLSPESSIR